MSTRISAPFTFRFPAAPPFSSSSTATYSNQLKAGAILEALWPHHPDHPGIPHYLIHSYDYPPLAERALAAAERYAWLAPASVHALHMPSHAFAMLGRWREVIAQESKTRAGVIALYPEDAPKHREPALIPGLYHTFDFLIVAYLQIADDANALAIVDERNRLAEFPSSFRITGHTAYAAIPVRFAIERGQWTDAARLAVPRTPYPRPRPSPGSDARSVLHAAATRPAPA